MCGSNDIIKQEGVYVCQSCGTKYSPEEAKKLMVEGTVTIDKSSEKENLKTLAKRYYENEEWEKADDYYDRIIELDPHDWEAIYYGGLASAFRSTFDNLRVKEAVIGYENAIPLIDDDKKDDLIPTMGWEVLNVCQNSKNFVINTKAKVGSDCSENDVYLYLNNLYTLTESYDKTLELIPAQDQYLTESYEEILDLCTRLKGTYEWLWGWNADRTPRRYKVETPQNYISYANLIESKYHGKVLEQNPDYKLQKPPKEGCYVATCVYGSYDCPEVWTLRRFRDNTLRQSFLGRTFIKCYYATSPTIVKYFGDYKVFNSIFKPVLDKFVNKLQDEGIDSTVYFDE